MAANKKIVKRTSYVHFQKLAAATQLIAFLVVMIEGLRANVGIFTISVRALGVMLITAIVSRIVIQVMATFEEMHGGKG